MNKYIDADRLRKEIEWRLSYIETATGDYAEGRRCELRYLLSIIDVPRQKQPDFPTTDEQMKEFLATHPKVKVPEKYKNPDWLFKKKEQPSLPDLDEAAEEYMKKARKHLFDDSPIGRADDAFKAGAEWQKEQMMKEAVEGEIQMRYSGCLCAKTIRAINEDKFKLGDKVHIIIIKEEKQ